MTDPATCPQCGAPLRHGVDFCTNCGTKTTRPEPEPTAVQQRTCPSCGRPVDPYDRFCRECGAPGPGRADGADDATRPLEPLGAAAVGPGGGAPSPRDRRSLWAMVAIAVLVVAGAAVAVIMSTGGDDDARVRTDTGSHTATGSGTDTGSTDFTVPSIPDFTVPSIPDFTVPSIPDFTVPSIPDFTVPSIPDFTVPSIPDFGSQIPSAPGFSSSPSGGSRRTVQLTALARSASGDCGMPGYVVIGGRRYEGGFVQCGADLGDRATGRFEVDLGDVPHLAPDARLEGFAATVGIDEASTAPVTAARFRVSYGTRILCTVTVRRNHPARCVADGLDLPLQPGLRLEMRQDVRSGDPSRPLFAAFVEPEVTFR